MWGLIILSCVFVLLLGIAAVVDLRDHDRGDEQWELQRTAERAR